MANEGALDRTIRVVAGAVILSLAFWGPTTPLGYLGLVPLATGLFGYCPLYRVFGWDTRAAPSPKA